MRFSKVRLDHTAVITKNLVRDLEWYTKKFSCSLIYQDETWGLLDFDNICLALVTKGEHPNHFAIIDPTIKKDKRAKRNRDGIFFKYENDPSGNVIEKIDRASALK